MVSFNFNITNFTQEIFVYAFSPYVSIFGNLTWGIIFGFVGAGVYVGSNSIPTTFGYLCIIGLIFGAILPQALIAIFGLIAAFIGASVLYNAFISSRHVG